MPRRLLPASRTRAEVSPPASLRDPASAQAPASPGKNRMACPAQNLCKLYSRVKVRERDLPPFLHFQADGPHQLQGIAGFRDAGSEAVVKAQLAIFEAVLEMEVRGMPF